MSFESIPIRSNGSTDIVEASWWNIIRTKLIEAFPGLPSTTTGSFSLVNNQSSFANVTGLLLDKDEARTYVVRYEILRSTDTPTSLYETGTLTFNWSGTAWITLREIDSGNALGLGIDTGPFGDLRAEPSTGQVEYKTENLSGGSYAGTLKWRIVEVWNV